jgi:heme/copper-type cytochrome/quinol oxidase subunit 2
MIDESIVFAILILSIIGAVVGIFGGVAGIFAFCSWQRKRFFLDYLNMKLSNRSEEDEN